MNQQELEQAASSRGNFDEMRGEIPMGYTKAEMPITRKESQTNFEDQMSDSGETAPKPSHGSKIVPTQVADAVRVEVGVDQV